jgi:hypothetical protein
MIDDDDFGVIGGIKIGRGNRNVLLFLLLLSSCYALC